MAELTKSDVKDEVVRQLSSNALKDVVKTLLTKELKGNKDLEKEVTRLTSEIIKNLFKTLYTKDSFWKNSI